MKVIWSKPGAKDLVQIRSFIAENNPLAAANVAKAILAAAERLRRFPSMGRAGRLPDTRELIVPRTPFIILYTVRKRTVEIVAVLHAARKWP